MGYASRDSGAFGVLVARMWKSKAQEALEFAPSLHLLVHMVGKKFKMF